MQFASVILDIPTRALDAPYTYIVPEEEKLPAQKGSGEACNNELEPAQKGSGTPNNTPCSAGDVRIGCAVLVPFGNRQQVGFVVDISDKAPDCDPKKLKSIIRVLSKPYFTAQGAVCALWLSERYIAPLCSCVRLFTPPGGVPRIVKTRDGKSHVEEPKVGEVDDRWVLQGPAFQGFVPRKNAIKQAAIVDALRAGQLRVAELACEFGAVSAPLKALEKQKVVRIEKRRRMRGINLAASTSIASSSFTPSPKPQLTPGQKSALDTIEKAASKQNGQVVLIDGVTGSGKTEVYLQAIESVLNKGKTALVLVPEISLTPQTVGRFRGRFGNMVAVMHSRMSQGERYDQWDFVASGQARVVVGARSALFVPIKNLGLIVIDEEHESTYKQDSAPRYHARDVALYMAKRAGATLVLGSATPAIDSLYACAKDNTWHHAHLPERANGRPLPVIEVIDMAHEFQSGSRSMFSYKLKEALRAELGQNHKAVLMLNQRGFAKFLLCRDCGFVPECPSCSTSLTYHERGGMLICHHCDYKTRAPAICPRCSSPYLKKFGAGTQRVEAELRTLLDSMPEVEKDVPIIRMDADTTSAKGAHQRLLEEFGAADAAVLLGTQMIAKGLDFKDVTLVGVINADTQLYLPDYRAAERTFALIEQVAGRAGRAELAGRVLVQTYEAQNCAIRAAATYNRALFLRDELPKRKMLGYPPYVRMANVRLWGNVECAVKQVAQNLQKELAEFVQSIEEEPLHVVEEPTYIEEKSANIREEFTHIEEKPTYIGEKLPYSQEEQAQIEVLPASPCVLEKLRKQYRWHIVIKCPLDIDLSAILLPFFRARKAIPGVNLAVDIDPNDLL